MANQITDKYLYTVRVGEHFTVSNVEARSAQEAIELATRNLDGEHKQVLDVRAEKLYEAGISVENDTADENESPNAITEISIRGTDPDRVDALKRAIGYLIAGPHHGDETEFNPDKVGETQMLERELEKLYVTAY